MPDHTFELVDDISEFMTYAALSVFHAVPVVSQVRDSRRVRDALVPELSLLDRFGVSVTDVPGGMAIAPPTRVASVDVEATSAGVYSDHQPLLALMLLRGDREACLTDRVWSGRYAYAEGLVALGADIVTAEDGLRIRPSVLARSGRVLAGRDTRSAAALLIAALRVPGTRLRDALLHLDRGYDGLLQKLSCLGAAVSSEQEPS